MKRVSTWLVACALSFPFPVLGETTLNDQTNVHALVEKMTAAFEAQDIDTVLQSYQPEARVVFEPGNPTTGDAALRERFTAFAAIGPEFTYTGHEVVVAGDTALHLAPWSMTATLPDGQEIAQTGLSVAVMKRQADGSWKMVIDHPYGDHMGQAN